LILVFFERVVYMLISRWAEAIWNVIQFCSFDKTIFLGRFFHQNEPQNPPEDGKSTCNQNDVEDFDALLFFLFWITWDVKYGGPSEVFSQ
jgi:hypothetical protein